MWRKYITFRNIYVVKAYAEFMPSTQRFSAWCAIVYYSDHGQSCVIEGEIMMELFGKYKNDKENGWKIDEVYYGFSDETTWHMDHI